MKKTWNFLDTESNLYIEELDIVGQNQNYSVSKRRLSGGPNDNVDTIKIDNGAIKVCVIPTRGMGIWYVRKDDWRLGWKSPTRGPVNPKLVNLFEPSGIGWLRGFDEMIARCGLECNGAPEFNENGTVKYPLHGCIQNTPASKVTLSIDEDEGIIELVGEVVESCMFGESYKLTSTVTLKIGENQFHINDKISNLYNRPQKAQLLYHINFGEGTVAEGSPFFIPYKKVAPRSDWAAENMNHREVMDRPVSQTPEVCFYYEPATDADGATAAMVAAPDQSKGVMVKFNVNQLPCFCQWKNPVDLTEGYVCGLEPGVNYPNTTGYEQAHGRTISLAPLGSWQCDLDIVVCPDAASTTAAREYVQSLIPANPTVESKPLAGWCE